jgi:hypothetical protein
MVWLGDTIATHHGPEVLASGLTDEKGAFQLQHPAELAGRGRMWSPTLWAFKPPHRITFIEFKRNLPGADEPVRLALGSPSSSSLRVVRPDGKPGAGAQVRAVQLNFKAPRPPDKLLDRLVATTDSDGRATLEGLALGDIFSLDVTLPGQVVQCLPVDVETGTLALRPVGRLDVRVVAEDPRTLKGWTITASSWPTEAGYRGPYTTHWARGTTADDGRAEFPPLAEGQVLWNIKPPEGSAYLVARQPPAMIRAGAVETVDIAIRRGVRIEGIVRESPSGDPIAGVKLDIAPLQAGSRTFEWLVTDAQGRFSTVVIPGTTRFGYGDTPKSHFLPPSTPHWADFEVKEGEDVHHFDPPPLRRAVQVRGQVIDEAGTPAAGVTVASSWISPEYGKNPNTARAETDARGEFVLGSIAPRSEVRIRASAGAVADSELVTIAADDADNPITLRLKKQPTLALAGRVLGRLGDPLADASVRVKIRPPDQLGEPGGRLRVRTF